MNRYSYCFNNPLKFIDPSGYYAGPCDGCPPTILPNGEDPINPDRQNLCPMGSLSATSVSGGGGYEGFMSSSSYSGSSSSYSGNYSWSQGWSSPYIGNSGSNSGGYNGSGGNNGGPGGYGGSSYSYHSYNIGGGWSPPVYHAPNPNVINNALNNVQNGRGRFITNWDIAGTAYKYVGSRNWALGRSKGDFGPGDYKCNLFVYDVLNKVGISPGLPNKEGFISSLLGLGHGPYPPTAGQWADPNYKIHGWRVLSSDEFPMTGDIAAISHPLSLNATGHVGIVFFNGRTISQSSITNRISISSWGFNPGDATVFRRYVGY